MQFEFVALLLFDGSPLVLTLRKFAELFGFAERSHQLLPINGCPPLPIRFYESGGVISPQSFSDGISSFSCGKPFRRFLSALTAPFVTFMALETVPASAARRSVLTKDF